MLLMFGAKDMGSGNVTSAVARIAEQRGHKVVAYVEGPSVGIFCNAQIQGVKPGLELSILDTLLSGDTPDYIVTGMSFPQSTVEQNLQYFAKAYNIPLVLIEDVPGASRRTRRLADYVFTTDEIGLAASQAHHLGAQCFIAGNIGVKKVTPSPEMVAKVSALPQNGQIYMFTESTKPGHGSINEQFDSFIGCVKKTPESLFFIIRLHPKWKGFEEGGVSLHDIWMMKLRSEIGDRLVEMPDGSTDELAVLTDGVISVFSTLLTTAAYHGKVAISLRTPLSIEFMQEATGFETAHIVQLGCATEVTEPRDLSTIDPASAEARAKLLPFNPELVCDMLERTLGR